VAQQAGWSVPALAEAYLAGGARFIQVRSKHSPSGAFFSLCQDVVGRARKRGALVIVNDRADIARLANADGVHVGQDDLGPVEVRRILGDAAIVGLSTHSIDQLRAGLQLPVSYVAIGPVFPTPTKETGYRAVGTGIVSEAAAVLRDRAADLPLVAIGGITLARAADVIRAGASSVAVISDLLATGDPEARVREYLAVLEGSRLQ
jgi:thiamine-phosphate pyrophosphorylase